MLPYLAVELGYVDYGNQRFGATGYPTCCHPGPNPLTQFSMERKVAGGVLDVVAEWPFAERWSLIGSAGLARLRVRTHGQTDFAATPYGPATQLESEASDSSSVARGSIGIAWRPGDGWAVRLQGEATGSVGEARTTALVPASGESRIRALTVSLVRDF